MSERNEPVDPRHEEALTAALRAQAETVRPAGDGLIDIRARVERRRLRSRFLIPVATAATVAATVTAVVASGILAGSSDKPGVSALETTSLAAATTTAKPSPAAATAPPTVSAKPSVLATSAPVVVTSAVAKSTSPGVTPVVAAGGPTGPVPIWPFADQAAADAWQKTAATSPDSWHLDPRATAVHFVDALKLPPTAVTGGVPRINADGSATVDLTRVATADATSAVVGTVRLVRWSTEAEAPWGVLDVTSPAGAQLPLAITSPTEGARISAPLPVSFTLTGAEDDVYVSAWAAGTTSPAATQQTVAGTSTTVTLASALPSTGTGFVVVADGSSGAGAFALSRLAVTPVEFGPPFNPLPTYVAVTNGTLRVLDTTTNAEVDQLAVGTKGITQVTVGVDRQWVYYLAPSGFMRTQLNGTGQPMTETTADGMHKITGISIAGPHDERLAYLAASPAGDGQWIYWSAGSGRSGQIEVSRSLPPVAESLAISPDGTQLSAFVRTGNQGNVMTFDLATAKTLADATSPKSCTTAGSECVGEAYAANGDLLTVTSDGTKFVVYRQHGSTPTKLFSVTAAGQGATLDTDPTGTKVLLTDGVGHAWSWAGSGSAKALPGAITDASW